MQSLGISLVIQKKIPEVCVTEEDETWVLILVKLLGKGKAR